MDANLLYVNDTDFDEKVLGSDKPVLVDFWAEWCGPCRIVGPIVERIAGERSTEIVVAKLNIDESPIIAQRYGIISIPTLVVFNAGIPIEGTVGSVPYEPLRDWIESLLGRLELQNVSDSSK